MPFSLADFHHWPLLTRLGEMQLLVPAALIAILAKSGVREAWHTPKKCLISG
jgi:hypothetical protein